MSATKNKSEKEINDLIKTIVGILNVAKTDGLKNTAKKMKMISSIEIDETRNQIINIITEEVCKYYLITVEALRFGKKYIYDTPRLITFKLLYLHTNMTITEIANYFNKSYTWVQIKISSFKKLKIDVECDKEILHDYDKIYKSIMNRFTSLANCNNSESEDNDE